VRNPECSITSNATTVIAVSSWLLVGPTAADKKAGAALSCSCWSPLLRGLVRAEPLDYASGCWLHSGGLFYKIGRIECRPSASHLSIWCRVRLSALLAAAEGRRRLMLEPCAACRFSNAWTE